MAFIDSDEIFRRAQEQFKNGNYSECEPLLQQMLMLKPVRPEVFHMLATISYERGKFNRAIKYFKRALEINPKFTDASVGLSIILNDLGRYDEAKQVYNNARNLLDQDANPMTPYVCEKIAKKHEELAALYTQYNRHEKALEQLKEARDLCVGVNRVNLIMLIVECLLKIGDNGDAIIELRKLIQAEPNYLPARLKLGTIYYNVSRVAEAVEQWEKVVACDPLHQDANRYLRMASELSLTEVSS